ncbi:MAG: hypothetical protein U0I39_06685 [Clostridia bacterium]|jgi:hypothetical protein|nr:hypothetical protein [Clostridia bacterium]DAQ69764.1 MAG TPA: hypothetical protein [Caudoviricetes sp.]
MIKNINYANKQAFQNDEDIPENQKVTDQNMNEIKEIVNNNAKELDSTQKKITTVINAPLKYKGSVEQFSDLEKLENVNNGDIYSVTTENKNYIYAEDEWVEYTPEIDLTEINAQIQNLQTQINNIPTITSQITSLVTEEEIQQNTNYEVPKYVLGDNSIEIYFEGCKLIKDINYIEADVTHIQFKDWNVPHGSNLEIIIRKGEE